MKNTLIPLIGLSATFTTALFGQSWQLIDDFSGSAGAEWLAIGTPMVSTDNEVMSLTVTGNSTSTYVTQLPEVYSSGKFTIAFDMYLPTAPAPLQHQAGFGINSASQVTGAGAGGWGPIGTNNRFQTVNDATEEAPQNLTKVPNWTEDALGTTEDGVWYNLWLVYDLDAMTVTLYSKKATEEFSLDALNSYSSVIGPREGQDPVDDFSAVEYFGFGIGLDTTPPEGYTGEDALGLRADNIYVSTGENLTEKPTAVAAAWAEVDTFDGGSPDATWGGDTDDMDLSFDDAALLAKAPAGKSRVSIYAPLPETTESGITTITFDAYFPSGGSNHAIFGVAGEDQVSQSGAARLGGNDRYITFGGDPQNLTKYTDWGNSLLPGDTQDTWYHIWVVYDLDAMEMHFYAAPFESTAPAEPIASYTLETDYTDISYFVVGAEVGGGEGIQIDNIYQGNAALTSLSPTAGEIGGGDPTPSSLLADAEDVGDGWYKIDWLGFMWSTSRDSLYVYHANFGWIAGGWYAGDFVWMQQPELGFLSTSAGLFPYVYSIGDGNWYYYIDGTTPAWFYDYDLGDYIQLEF